MGKTKLIVSGPSDVQEIVLEPRGVTLGRGSDCDVILDHENVSRHHARISQDPFGRWIVEDMGSRNGVLLGEQRITAQAVPSGQQMSIRPFTLSIVEESGEQTVSGSATHSTIPVVDKGMDEQIVSYRADQAAALSPALVHHLNELTGHLLGLSRPSELYSEACSCLARMFDTLVAVLRLPCSSQPLPKSPEILACQFGEDPTDAAVLQTYYMHFSKRVLDAVRSTDSPVMAGSRQSSDQDLKLTIVDEHKPHLVFSARVHDLGDMIDALYIDIPENKSPKEMFDFVEAVARQINFVQKNLFLAELEKQQRALREANIQLKEKDRIKDEYVSRVTHDIKGHLAAIQNCLFITADESCGPLNDKQSDFLTRARNRTGQLTDFVKELLNLTQMRLSGRLQMEAFSLSEAIHKALASVEAKAKDKSITVTSDIDPSIGQIVGNEFSITEMLANLLFNAVKYTPENKTVHLQARSCDDHVQIEITDTGIGIPSDELEHVFDEFFRASNARKTERDGTGLGLSIVKQIVDRHGGQISAESEIGQGSKFAVKLPRKRVPAGRGPNFAPVGQANRRQGPAQTEEFRSSR